MWSRIRLAVQRVSLVAAASAVAITTGQQLGKDYTSLGQSESPSLNTHYSTALRNAIDQSRALIKRFKEETGAPGIVVGVSIDGKKIWEEGIGYSDLENQLPCSPNTVMRIASISKSITMAAVAKIWEDGKLDLDKPVQDYVPDFPVKYHNGEKVIITTRHLVSHLSGIRHYKEAENKDVDPNCKKQKYTNEFLSPEYLIKDHYQSVVDSLKLFKDDPVVFKPGSSYLYTTYGWTLVSAIVEAVVKKPFTDHVTQMLKDFGMNHTHLEVNEKLIPHRSRFYVKNKKAYIENAPYVDNSYKWAGGGMLSTVGDLLQFGNIMLYSYQCRIPNSSSAEITYSQPVVHSGPLHTQQSPTELKLSEDASPTTNQVLPGFLKHQTVSNIWTPVPLAKTPKSFYGMGWMVVPSKREYGFCEDRRLVAAHSGAAVGASSVLLIMPGRMEEVKNELSPPKGIVVSILTNLQQVSLWDIGFEIVKNFDAIATCSI